MYSISWKIRTMAQLVALSSFGLFIFVHISHDDSWSSTSSLHQPIKRRVLESESSDETERVYKKRQPSILTNQDKPLPLEYVRKNVSALSKPTEPTYECDDECDRFHTMLSSWPQDRPRAAIYFLTRTIRWSFFTKALASVDEFFNNEYKYPIIIFHEEEFVKNQNAVRLATKSDVYFQKLTFSIPPFLEEPVPINIPCVSTISYRHMCRFHAKVVYEHPIMQNLQYYWRLDDDSLLLSEVKYDVFKHMQTNNIRYGYIWRHLDAYSCVKGLWEATRTYIDAKNLTTFSFDSWKRPWLYYNNFEISELDTWLSQPYKDYIDYIDRLGGIYYHRWGDAPIRGIAVSMFIPKAEIHYFDDIGYQHRTYIHNSSKLEKT